MTPSSRLVSSTIDGVDSNEEIAEIFADKFESLYKSIPTDSTEMGSIENEIKKLIINEDSVNECNVSFRDIHMAIKNLNKRKGDVNYGFYSNGTILSTNKFKTIIVMLINHMLINGHNAEDLLASVIALIPQNLQSSLNTSDNYRVISQCKVFYYILLTNIVSI